jgi:hypothetical protein
MNKLLNLIYVCDRFAAVSSCHIHDHGPVKRKEQPDRLLMNIKREKYIDFVNRIIFNTYLFYDINTYTPLLIYTDLYII